MPSAGTYPEAGVRVALELRATDESHARYQGEAFTPLARYAVSLQVEIASGKTQLELQGSAARDPEATAPDLEAGDLAFLKALGTQLWRQAVKTPADQGGGVWSRRIQRWRGPK